MHPAEISKLWTWTAVTCLAFLVGCFLVERGGGGEVPLFGNVHKGSALVVGVIVGGVLLVAVLWLAARYAKTSGTAPLIRRLPTLGELTLDGRDGGVVRIVIQCVTTVVPLVIFVHLVWRLLARTPVWDLHRKESIGTLWRLLWHAPATSSRVHRPFALIDADGWEVSPRVLPLLVIVQAALVVATLIYLIAALLPRRGGAGRVVRSQTSARQ